MSNAFFIFLSKVLRGKNACSGYTAEQTEIIDKEQLIDNGYAGHLFCADLPDHDVVQQTHKVGNAVLNHDGYGDGQYHFVKIPISYEFVSDVFQESHPHILQDQPAFDNSKFYMHLMKR